ncbi:hypothetical protein J3Q64DRAFT_1699969 [Phycomyces blakesleeanus]|uniref:Uncharacterized protein n=2 Tax=Phycomyces blakesleeanus TaxID=4837 RepID=A0A162UBA9_PHYB8|nr:hypothetical protein PHYBLDRAFT_168235 [Phycomyces blakesleeanus NRRL 1555(-)]OAD73803.1 hypothetical protein PHYBLDRAFT_168235 [Phycomyces blakesleeanus NRRL 1555(-)]|eukprot:XP_018291843.1 hypothetical protein PHYBLDRAFT_168235 [Phycomyces blakesleeanus NRRL 1555(-)]
MTFITTTKTTTEGFANKIYTFDLPIHMDAIKSIIRQQVENQRLERPHIVCGVYTNPPVNPYKHFLPSPPIETTGEKTIKSTVDHLVETHSKKDGVDVLPEVFNETKIQDKIKALEEEKHALFQHLKTLLSSQSSQRKPSLEPTLEQRQEPIKPSRGNLRSNSRENVNSRKSRSRSVSHPDYKFTASRYTPYKSTHRQDFFDRTRNYDRQPYHLSHISTLPDTQLLTHHALLAMPYMSRRMPSYSASRQPESVRLPFRSSRGLDRNTPRY